mmetsp:Transcript_27969/g.59049  ORF Transcript_27969/g.59049 Transcript_27969/m.59049 type:complete len:80 (-) Transcript_27969:351-590(-)
MYDEIMELGITTVTTPEPTPLPTLFEQDETTSWPTEPDQMIQNDASTTTTSHPTTSPYILPNRQSHQRIRHTQHQSSIQ